MKLEIKGWIRFHIRLVGANGEVLMHSETYYNRSNAERAARRLVKQLNVALTYNDTPGA